MAKADDIYGVIRAAIEANREQLLLYCRRIINSEPSNSALRRRIEHLLVNAQVAPSSTMPKDMAGLAIELIPALSLQNVQVPAAVREQLEGVLAERAHTEALHAAGLRVPHKILLSGPPGNGKTALAGALASALKLPFYVLDFSTVLSSFFGESGGKVAKVFRASAQVPCVLFVDEIETVLSERSGRENTTDVGEIARLVSALLLEMDRLPDHVVLIGATNHTDLLDRAVIRRFDHHWTLPAPDSAMVQAWLRRFAARYPAIPILHAMPMPEADGRSIAEIERDVLAWCRLWVMARPEANRQPISPPTNGASDESDHRNSAGAYLAANGEPTNRDALEREIGDMEREIGDMYHCVARFFE